MITDTNIEEIVKRTNKNIELDSIADKLIERFYTELISENDKMLLDLIFQKNPTQEKLDNFLAHWDIEAAGSHKALLLSYFMKENPELKFSNYELPRLNGLLKFYRFKNLDIISHFTRIGKALNAANIPLVLLKGGAMKSLRPDLPRQMGDTDVLVQYNQFFKALDTVEAIGYVNEYERERIIHAADLHYKNSDAGVCDLHRYIYMQTGCEKKLNKDLFKRAHKSKVFGVETLIPSNEDMLFITLVNLAKNLRDNTSKPGILFAIYDCKWLVENKPDFDWNIVLENAKKTKTQVQVGFGLRFINNIASEILPESLRRNDLFKNDITNYCAIVMYNRFYLQDVRIVSKEIKIGEVLRNPLSIGKYMGVKPEYALMKAIRNNATLIKLYFRLIKHEDK